MFEEWDGEIQGARHIRLIAGQGTSDRTETFEGWNSSLRVGQRSLRCGTEKLEGWDSDVSQMRQA